MPHLTESRVDSWLDKKGGAAAALFDATRNLGLGEPPKHGFCVEERPYHLLDDRVLLPMVPLSIFLRYSKN
jgi:hypothetical protein